jgi:hypothetical protein
MAAAIGQDVRADAGRRWVTKLVLLPLCEADGGLRVELPHSLLGTDEVVGLAADEVEDRGTKRIGNEGELTKPVVAIYKTPGKTTAATVPVEPDLVIFIGPRIIEQDQRWGHDTLLHEMIHVALIEENGDGDAEHGKRFITWANKIGQNYDLPKVAPCSSEARSWPQSVRPSTYPEWNGGDCPIHRTGAELQELPVHDDERRGICAGAESEDLVVFDEGD